MRDKNMVDVLEGLKHADHKFLCHVINSYAGKEQVDVHEGSLPFINRSYAYEAARFYQSELPAEGLDKVKKQLKRIIDALTLNWDNDSVTFQMFLDKQKVIKMLGRQVDFRCFEVRLPFTTEVECGIQWKEFGKVYEKTAQILTTVATVRQVNKSLWEVSCKKTLLDSTRNWFFTRFH